MAIQIIQDGRRPPFWIMDGSVFGKSSTLRDLLPTYTPNSAKISWSAAEICPQNWIRKKTFLSAEFYFLFQLWRPQSSGDLRVCHRAKFQPKRTIDCRVISILGPLSPSLLCGDQHPRLRQRSVGPQECSLQTALWNRSAVFAQWSRVEPRDRRTDGQTPHISYIRCSLTSDRSN